MSDRIAQIIESTTETVKKIIDSSRYASNLHIEIDISAEIAIPLISYNADGYVLLEDSKDGQ